MYTHNYYKLIQNILSEELHTNIQ